MNNFDFEISLKLLEDANNLGVKIAYVNDELTLNVPKGKEVNPESFTSN